MMRIFWPLLFSPLLLSWWRQVSAASPPPVDSTLAQIFVVSQHGTSTPFTSLPGVHVDWKSGPGSLTPDALREGYQLGKDLRRRLVGASAVSAPQVSLTKCDDSSGALCASPVSAEGLLSANYTSSQVYARSTSFERSVAHAQSVLLGLFPPGTGPVSLPLSFQPVPVHAPPDIDDVMLRAGDKCQALSDALELLYASDRWRDKESESQPLLAKVSSLLGVNVTLRAVPLYGEVVASLRDQGLLGGVMSNSTASEFLQVYDWVEYARLEGKQAGRVVGGILLGQIVDDMQLRVARRVDAGPVFNLFSVHADSIMALYSALALPWSSVPPPGFHLTFELHGNATSWPNTVSEPLRSRSPEDFYVLVKANGSPLGVPGCSTDAQPECRFDLFVSTVGFVTQTYPEWEKDCRRLAPPPSVGPAANGTECDDANVQLSAGEFALISCGVALGGTLLGIAIGYICHKRSTIRVQQKYLKLVESGVLSY